MENEQHHYELRSRSRSRSHTPMVSNRPLPESEVTEHHYDLRSKSRERSHTPGEITSSRRSGSRSLTGSSSKMHDKSMETIEESKEGSVIESVTDNQSTKSESSTVTTRKVERRSERQRAKRQIFANGQSESKEDTSDRKAEQKRKSITPRRILTSDYSSEEGEREDPPSRPGSAYKIYKQAGEWWNVFPKTDYTYSRTSQCRYEIAPGVLAMPNMSRRSIHTNSSGNNTQISHQSLNQASPEMTESGFDDVTDARSLLHSTADDYNISHVCTSNCAVKSTVYRKTHMEHYSSHKETLYSNSGDFFDSSERYPSWSNVFTNFTNKYRTPQYPDSDMEFDENFVLSSVETNQRWRIVQWFTYFITFITLWSKKIIEFFKFSSNKKQHYDVHAHRFYYASKWNVLLKSFDYYSHKIYFFFVRMLVFDALLLSQFTSVRKRLQGRSLKILWITFLPLLLLLGCWCIAQCLPLFHTKTASVMKEKLSPNVQQWIDHTNVEDKLTSDNDLFGRIEKLENGQTYQMEHLMNVIQILENLKQNDADFRKEYNVNMENKANANELSMVYNRLKLIQYKFEKLHKVYSELKSCCNANAELLVTRNIEKHVEKILLSYFPPGTSKADLVKITQNLHASRNEEDQTIFNNDVSSARMSDEHIRKIVKDILDIYDADKTGRVDYALESAGGEIVSTRCTQEYDVKSRAYSILGFPLYYDNISPRTVIQGHTLQPGRCWAFQDFPGYLLIQLRSSIYVTGFTLEHVSKLLLPKENMSSAPKKFNVWGLIDQNDPEPIMFGDYEFVYPDDNLQYFSVQNMEINRPYKYVELRIHSNHGELNYTCLYRFRVHGKPI